MTSSAQAYSYAGSGGQRTGWLTNAETLPSSSKRKKLAGYLKAANELRQTYQDSAATAWKERNTGVDESWDTDGGIPGAFPDAAIVRSGHEQMVLFPSYARRRVKKKPRAKPGTIQEAPGSGGNVRDSPGTGDAEFWKEWQKYEHDHAVVDVDVRGWLYSPHRGQMNRKQRLFVSLARQLAGISAPPAGSSTQDGNGSQNDSSAHLHQSVRERLEARAARKEDEAVAQEAENILRKGDAEAIIAAAGGYSEKPGVDEENDQQSNERQNRDSSPSRGKGSGSPPVDPPSTPVQRRRTWPSPGDMSSAELATANSHLMQRLRPFLANPLANTAISAFFYNNDHSEQRTIYTDENGHFTMRAALNFVPTHVRILASEDLSATEEVNITETRGISLISDIDDTIKHSAIGSGAREIFRNAFIRELDDLTIEGVREWYSDLSKLEVKFHYVSNSPWQLYQVLTKYISLAGLPPGSFHLKQYSGMLQGIFEPVAERKKKTLDKLARDFPERSFILVGDSGEADLEVYTDFVRENPGRVLGVFIRDVTTALSRGFFNSANPRSSNVPPGASPGRRTSPTTSSRTSPNRSPRLGPTREFGSTPRRSGLGLSSSSPSDDEDEELQAAIKASLKDLEDQERGLPLSVAAHRALPDRSLPDALHEVSKRPQLPQRRPTGPAASEPSKMEPPLGNLIDLDDDAPPSQKRPPLPQRLNTAPSHPKYLHGIEELSKGTKPMVKVGPPIPPRKPVALQSKYSQEQFCASSGHTVQSTTKLPPPKPRQSSSAIALSDQTEAYPQNEQPSGTSSVSQIVASVYNALPAVAPHLSGYRSAQPNTSDGPTRKPVLPPPDLRAQSIPERKQHAPILPPPPRRMISAYPVAAAQYASNRVSVLWNASEGATSTSNPTSKTYSTRSNTDRAGALEGTATSNSRLSMHQGLNEGSFRGDYWDQQPQLSKKEAMWQQRLNQAAQTFRENGVLLKIWRTGSDAEKVCMELVQKALQSEKDGKVPKPRYC